MLTLTVSLSISRTLMPGPLSSIIFEIYCFTAKTTFIFLQAFVPFPPRKNMKPNSHPLSISLSPFCFSGSEPLHFLVCRPWQRGKRSSQGSASLTWEPNSNYNSQKPPLSHTQGRRIATQALGEIPNESLPDVGAERALEVLCFALSSFGI